MFLFCFICWIGFLNNVRSAKKERERSESANGSHVSRKTPKIRTKSNNRRRYNLQQLPRDDTSENENPIIKMSCDRWVLPAGADKPTACACLKLSQNFGRAHLISMWAREHSRLKVETGLRSVSSRQGRRNIRETREHINLGTAIPDRVSDSRLDETTRYRVHVMSSSVTCRSKNRPQRRPHRCHFIADKCHLCKWDPVMRWSNSFLPTNEDLFSLFYDPCVETLERSSNTNVTDRVCRI